MSCLNENQLILQRHLVVKRGYCFSPLTHLANSMFLGHCTGGKCGWRGAVQWSRAVPDAVLRARGRQQHLRFEGVRPAEVRDIAGHGRGRGRRGQRLQADTTLLSVHLPGYLLGPPLQPRLWDHVILHRPGGAPAHRHRPRHQIHHPAPTAWHQLQVGVPQCSKKRTKIMKEKKPKIPSASKPSAGFESRRSTAWALAPLVTPLSWRRSPCPRSRPAWSAPPSAIRPSGSNGAMAQPKPPPQMPFSISCRWKTRAAGQRSAGSCFMFPGGWIAGLFSVWRPPQLSHCNLLFFPLQIYILV